MRSSRLSLKEFIAQFPLAGTWEVSYSDATHIPSTDQDRGTVKLGNISIDSAPDEVRENVNPFSFLLDSRQEIGKRFQDVWSAGGDGDDDTRKIAKEQAKAYSETVYSGVSETLARVGICPPIIDPRDLEALGETKALIFITDTNVIRWGIVSYLANIFEDKPIWVIVPVVSMLELQDSSGRVKWLSSKAPKDRNYTYVKNRPMSTSSTRELMLLKGRVPVEFLEVPPELLRYYKGTDKILQDRLILEGIKQIIKEKSTAEKMCLLSGDVDIVRFAKLENLEAIYTNIRKPVSSGEKFYSVRYDVYKKGFIACGTHEFLWDLTQVFSFIKLRSTQSNKTITLEYYFQGRGVRDWEDDILEVTELDDE